MERLLYTEYYQSFYAAKKKYAINLNHILAVADIKDLPIKNSTQADIVGYYPFIGTYIPVVDFRKKNSGKSNKSNYKNILILEIPSNHENVVIGILIDQLENIIELNACDLSQIPIKHQTKSETGIKAECILLNIKSIFSYTELSKLEMLRFGTS